MCGSCRADLQKQGHDLHSRLEAQINGAGGCLSITGDTKGTPSLKEWFSCPTVCCVCVSEEARRAKGAEEQLGYKKAEIAAAAARGEASLQTQVRTDLVRFRAP